MNRLNILLLFLSMLVVTLASLSAWAQETPRLQSIQRVENSDEGRSAAKAPLIFTSNEILPPMIYLKDGQRVGIVVDLAEAIIRHMHRPVRIRYMDWAQAQQQVLEGKADAVLHINPSKARNKIFDFSDELLATDFSIFIQHSNEAIYSPDSLRGHSVGVLNKGLCFNLLKEDPLINLVTYSDILPGFIALSKGKLDAVVMDRQVGIFLLAENNIRGIRTTDNPIDRSGSAIAVKKGNTDLLTEINRALAEIKKNETYAEIMAKWEPKEVVFQTREQALKQKRVTLTLLLVSGLAVLTILFVLFWNKSLKSKVVERTSELMTSNTALEAEIAERKKAHDYLKNLADSIGDVVFSVKLPERKIEWINDRTDILGYTPEECLGKGTDFFYANRNEYLAIGEMLAKAIAEGKDIIYTEANLRRKSGENFPAKATLTLYRKNNEVVSLTGIMRDITARKIADQQIMAYQKRLKALATQLTVAEEKERRRIAVDLHDNVCQSLALTLLQVAAVRKNVLEPALTVKLDDVSATIEQSLQDTRHLMSDLSSSLMNEIGLSAAISGLLEETIAKQHNLKTEFTDDLDDHRREILDDNVRTVLFRNVRELVTNVVKHARAKNVSVRILEEDSRVKIIVKDDGIGFDPDDATSIKRQDSEFGLFSIEERMSDMGGAFEIVSEPDKGCEAILTLPVRIV